jgi:hypothetical protein
VSVDEEEALELEELLELDELLDSTEEADVEVASESTLSERTRPVLAVLLPACCCTSLRLGAAAALPRGAVEDGAGSIGLLAVTIDSIVPVVSSPAAASAAAVAGAAAVAALASFGSLAANKSRPI